MIVAIDVPYVDTSAASLRLLIGGPRRPAQAVAHRTVTQRPVAQGAAGVFDVELRLLSASHQVIVRDGSVEFSETVACLGDDGTALTPSYDGSTGHFGYAITSSVRRHGERDFAAAVDARCAATQRADGLVGAYPGNPLALTGVYLDPEPLADLRWHTWHSYPQSGEIVLTETALTIHHLAATSGGRL